MKRLLLIFTGALLCLSSTAYAATIPAVVGWENINGPKMTGMEVTATGTNVDGSALTWGLIDGNKYGVSGSGWELSFSGSDTFDTEWSLSVTDPTVSLDSLTINAIPGGVVFDIFHTKKVSINTPESQNGLWTESWYDPTLGSSGANSYFSWAFTDEVNVDGNPAEGDLFGSFFLDFTPGGGFGSKDVISGEHGSSEGVYRFAVDTDAIATVPVPSSMALLFLGGLGLFGIKRKDG